MNRYVIMGKYSSDFLAGMMHNPQDRKKATENFAKKIGLEYASGESYLHINHPDYDFICIMYGKSDEAVKSASDMMRATGNIEKFTFCRAWSTEEYTSVSKEASELVGVYVPASEN